MAWCMTFTGVIMLVWLLQALGAVDATAKTKGKKGKGKGKFISINHTK